MVLTYVPTEVSQVGIIRLTLSGRDRQGGLRGMDEAVVNAPKTLYYFHMQKVVWWAGGLVG